MHSINLKGRKEHPPPIPLHLINIFQIFTPINFLSHKSPLLPSSIISPQNGRLSNHEPYHSPFSLSLPISHISFLTLTPNLPHLSYSLSPPPLSLSEAAVSNQPYHTPAPRVLSVETHVLTMPYLMISSHSAVSTRDLEISPKIIDERIER